MIYQGSCHCSAIRFEVEAPEQLEVTECNCSICSKAGFLHLIVSKNKFKLLSGEDNLQTYTFNTGVAKHRFCRICGIKSFYTPRSHPDGISVNARCLDVALGSVEITKFDGQNWEESRHNLNHLK
jgi:hypothetical protein